eukprot:scaffold259324_cov17-Tisochrysis_lutea.AAC.1
MVLCVLEGHAHFMESSMLPVTKLMFSASYNILIGDTTFATGKRTTLMISSPNSAAFGSMLPSRSNLRMTRAISSTSAAASSSNSNSRTVIKIITYITQYISISAVRMTHAISSTSAADSSSKSSRN